MALAKDHKITLFGLFGAAILSAVLFIIIREYYSPDIRYEKGTFYILENSGITFIKIINYGHSDAEDIFINIFFNKLIKELSLSDKLISLKHIDGGKGFQSYSGEINRLVPAQEAFIYFSLDLQSFIPYESPCISSINIAYKGGFAETGIPIFTSKFMLAFLAGLLIMIISGIISWYSQKKIRDLTIVKARDYILKQIIGLIENNKLMDKDHLLKKINEIKNLPFEE